MDGVMSNEFPVFRESVPVTISLPLKLANKLKELCPKEKRFNDFLEELLIEGLESGRGLGNGKEQKT